MEVILLERVRNLGHLGETVNVKAGYARNYLLPYGKAVVANKANIAYFEQRRAELEKTAADLLGKANARAKQMEGLSIVITRKASEEGKLFGSVTVHDIMDAISAQNIEIEKRELNLVEGPIRSVGQFPLEVHLHSDVIVGLTITVEAE